MKILAARVEGMESQISVMLESTFRTKLKVYFEAAVPAEEGRRMMKNLPPGKHHLTVTAK